MTTHHMSRTTILGLLGVVIVGLAIAIPVAFDKRLASTPARDLAIVLLVGIVFLLLTLGLIVVLFSSLGLADSRYALALPEGSVRAVIALLLILLFFIASIFLVFETRTYTETTLSGVTADELVVIREKDRVIGQSVDPGSDPPTYTVRIRYDTGFNSDLAKQLLTTIGTLVVAVAAFYFGANSVAAATAAAQGTQLTMGDDLAAKVRAALSGDAFKDVTVSVAGRTAVLTGTVGQDELKSQVEKAALSVVGVEAVQNQLTVTVTADETVQVNETVKTAESAQTAETVQAAETAQTAETAETEQTAETAETAEADETIEAADEIAGTDETAEADEGEGEVLA